MDSPLVSVVCLCFNQKQFVREAVESVLQQTYTNVQLIVVDDGSTDGSQTVIQELNREYVSLEIILLERNIGNCAAFNRGLDLAKGEYVIDLAADDVLMTDRIARQVHQFQQLPQHVGVVFSDAEYIDGKGKHIRNHYQYLFDKKLLSHIPEGDVYRDVLSRYFIASPTMMIKKSVYDLLGGYDETLSYEDFDFWVRSSRYFHYGLLNEVLTKIRKTETSMSTGWYKRGDAQLHSTYVVCCKAIELNRDEDDKKALLIRIRYELRQAVFSENKKEAALFYKLLQNLQGVRGFDLCIHLLEKINLPVRWLRIFYHRIKYT